MKPPQSRSVPRLPESPNRKLIWSLQKKLSENPPVSWPFSPRRPPMQLPILSLKWFQAPPSPRPLPRLRRQNLFRLPRPSRSLSLRAWHPCPNLPRPKSLRRESRRLKQRPPRHKRQSPLPRSLPLPPQNRSQNRRTARPHRIWSREPLFRSRAHGVSCWEDPRRSRPSDSSRNSASRLKRVLAAGQRHGPRHRRPLISADDKVVALGFARDRLIDSGMEQNIVLACSQRRPEIGRVL